MKRNSVEDELPASHVSRFTSHAKIRWLCRRGMKELDVLLERFLADGYDELDEAGRADFLRLLECEDPVLWSWLLGHEEPYETGLRGLVERLREYRVSGGQGVTVPL